MIYAHISQVWVGDIRTDASIVLYVSEGGDHVSSIAASVAIAPAAVIPDFSPRSGTVCPSSALHQRQCLASREQLVAVRQTF